MMPFTLQKVPDGFEERCRKRGHQWLSEHPNYDRPIDYWSEFEPQLRGAFQELCAYCVMLVMKGQTDHFVPVALLKERGQDHRAYEWENFRYGEGVINQRKSKHIVLDPFDVKDDWFEMLLPSMQLIVTEKVPAEKRDLAEFTIRRLGLRDSEVVIRYRQKWFSLYRSGELTLSGLRKIAPLIARAVDTDLEKGTDWRDKSISD